MEIRFEKNEKNANGVKQPSLEKWGVSSTYINKIEKGEADPTLDIAGRIAKVLGIPFNEVFGEILTPEELDKEIEKLLDEFGIKIGVIDPSPVSWGYGEKKALLFLLRDILAQLAKKQKE